ncbi:MAG: hypothetical protein LBF95_01945 [Treponema sp.]|jgi:hypothetical protein|nr:hypothetical protein [Treponema sp.]
MKKRVFLFLVLAVVCGGGVFAQTHFVSAEASVLGGGARYEFVITPYFTVGLYSGFNFLPTPFLSDDLATSITIGGGGVAGRWYPSGRKFFTELSLGGAHFEVKYMERHYDPYKNYNSYTKTWEGGYDEWEESDGEGSFIIAPGFGWTIDIGAPGKLFISPGIRIPFAITPFEKDLGLGEGVYPSVVVYFGLGYAF